MYTPDVTKVGSFVSPEMSAGYSATLVTPAAT